MPRSTLILLVAAGCLTCRLAAPKPLPAPAAPASVTRDVAPEEKLDPALRELVGSGPAAKDAMAAWAAKYSVKASDTSVPVDITCKDPASVAAVATAMKASGGQVKTTFRNVVFGSVTESSIVKLASMPEVWSMALTQPTLRPIKFSQRRPR